MRVPFFFLAQPDFRPGGRSCNNSNNLLSIIYLSTLDGALVVDMEHTKVQMHRVRSHWMGFLAEFWRDEEVGSVPDVTDVYVKWLKSDPPNYPAPRMKQNPKPTIRQVNTPD